MKLRNKQTGEIVTMPDEYKVLWDMAKKLGMAEKIWVECKQRPAEPLIKDEKIRKAVKAWAEANGIERVWHECASCWLRGNGLSIEMGNEVDELEQGNYSITELCGEEEK